MPFSREDVKNFLLDHSDQLGTDRAQEILDQALRSANPKGKITKKALLVAMGRNNPMMNTFIGELERSATVQDRA